MKTEKVKSNGHIVEACSSCGCKPGDGITDGCYDPNGCGWNRGLHHEPRPERDADLPCGRVIPDITPEDNPFGWYDCDRLAGHAGPCGHVDLDAETEATFICGH